MNFVDIFTARENPGRKLRDSPLRYKEEKVLGDCFLAEGVEFNSILNHLVSTGK